MYNNSEINQFNENKTVYLIRGKRVGFMGKRLHHRFIFQVKNRIIFIFALCVIVPSILFLGFFIRSYSGYALNGIIQEKQNIMKETHKNIALQFSGFQDSSMSFYYNQVSKSYIDSEDYLNEDKYVSQMLSSIVNSEKYIVSAILELDGITYNAGYRYRNWDEYLLEHKEGVVKRKGKVVWIPTEEMSAPYNQTPKNFALGRAINSPNRQVGTLWMFFSEDLFDSVLKNPIFKEDNTDYYIISKNSDVVTSNRKEQIGSLGDLELCNRVLEQKNGSFSYKDKVSGQKKMVVCSSSELNDWVLFTVTEERILFKDVNSIKLMAVGISVLYALFLFIAYYILSTYIFKPMKNLSKGMQRVSHGDFERIDELDRNDEMGMLTSNFNYMTDEIQTLINGIREEEKAKNEEKIKVLSMQIGPHFIYNTLNTIKWMAVVNKQSNIKKMIESLIKLMVSVTYNTNEEISLSEEVELLNCYVYIQKMRYMNFDIEYDLPKEIGELKISKLILQPFVENCILYAFSDKPDVGKIHISFYTKDALYIEIADNGKGFDTSVLKQQKDSQKRSDHIGVQNVIERIRLNYGEAYLVQIESREEVGTKVLLRLPIIHGEVEEDVKRSDSGR